MNDSVVNEALVIPSSIGDDVAGMRKQPDVILIIGLEQKPHGSNFLADVKAKQTFGLEQQHGQQNDVRRDVFPAFRKIEAGHALDYADKDAANDRTLADPEVIAGRRKLANALY